MSRRYRILALLSLCAALPVAAQAAGVGYFSHHVGCSGTPSLYYSVAGGPANTCGDLETFRNGSWVTAGGWLCTDSNGNATKGPWTWAGTPGDQTDNPARIVWPNNTTTTNDWHVWDKTCPTVSRTSAGGSPPSAFSGTATDTTYGAGFRSDCGVFSYASFRDTTPGFNKYWISGSGYTSASYAYVYGTLTGVPSHSIGWSASVPPSGHHTSGHSYEWQSCVTDCCCASCIYYNFTVP